YHIYYYDLVHHQEFLSFPTRRSSDLWDSESDYIMQTVRDIEETVDISRNKIQEIENYDIIQRGSEAIQTVDGFLDKVWLNDFSEIGANLIPLSKRSWENGAYWSGNGN